MKDLIKRIHDNAFAKGFHEDFNIISSLYLKNYVQLEEFQLLKIVCINSKLALITSEIAECTEALRKGDDANFKEEIADVAIRIMDLAGLLDIDLEAEILKKIEINESRPYLHGKKF